MVSPNFDIDTDRVSLLARARLKYYCGYGLDKGFTHEGTVNFQFILRISANDIDELPQVDCWSSNRQTKQIAIIDDRIPY
jgi:hypothetical protein